MKRWALCTAAGALLMGATPVHLAPTPRSPISDVDAEPNNDFAHAVPLKAPVVNASGCIDPATDVDFYTFTLSDGSPLFIGAKAKGGAQFKLALYDAKHGVVVKGGDMIDLSGVDAGAYFVSISGIEKDCYELEIFAETRLPPFG